jgi:hypothetical protein
VVVYAGNSPLETARSIDQQTTSTTPAVVLEDGKPVDLTGPKQKL